MTKKAKDPAAVALGQKRWKGTSAKERAAHGAMAASTRWENTSEADRLAVGEKLAKARAAAKVKKTQL